MKGLKALFKVRETYIGIMAAILFQLIFFTIWMTAYDGVHERTGNLSVGLLNEDRVIGEQVAQQISKSLPFTVETFTSIEQAQGAMNDRNIDMIIQIPSNLTDSIQSGDDANIVYWINQANASLAKTMMESVAVQVTDQVNRSMYPIQQTEVAGRFMQQLEELPVQQEVAKGVGEAVLFALESLKDHPIEASVMKTNTAEGFAANLVPFMVIISSFVGAMVMVMQHQAAASSLDGTVSKWDLFFSRQLINIGVAFLLPLLTISLMGLFQISSQEPMLTVYFFQAMMFWAFLSLAQVFVLMFGNAGMVFNILALSLQLVTSGVLVPKALLSDWYGKVATFLPATYGADGYYTIIFGGSSTSIGENIQSLFIIVIVTLIISAGAVAIKRNRKGILEINAVMNH
ncbi:YhgE/Pip domain-containing protein [Sporosarcina limicola]|uniref:Phage infection (PIP) family protein YhgE n=1 Tax=Sporosarcina limicola TaxID=34101 RepID=A0A927MLZ6_9BACL|nr:ABC transporter permease [Sporosarcina limicola]MBE1555357.1 putative phage infection (PIP) family protein YhgE [Sporosarcina limicola]